MINSVTVPQWVPMEELGLKFGEPVLCSPLSRECKNGSRAQTKGHALGGMAA